MCSVFPDKLKQQAICSKQRVNRVCRVGALGAAQKQPEGGTEEGAQRRACGVGVVWDLTRKHNIRKRSIVLCVINCNCNLCRCSWCL